MLDEDLNGTNMLIVDTFDYNSHVFQLVSESEKYYLKYENSPKLITKLIIKPDLWAFFKDGGYEHGVRLLKPCHYAVEKVLAMDFNIDPSIFEILIHNGLISYSKGMADLYQLPVSYSRDIKSHYRDYKKSKNKELVLEKLRNGIFN